MSADAPPAPSGSRPGLGARLAALVERFRGPPATRLAALALALAHVVATAVDPERAATLALRAGGVVQAPWTIARVQLARDQPRELPPEPRPARRPRPRGGAEPRPGPPVREVPHLRIRLVGVFAFAVALVRFAATKDESILYADHRGAQGIVGALCLALRQAMPDAPINVRGLRWAKCRALPAAHCFFWAAVPVVAQDATAFVLALRGAYGGWVYARYLHPRPDGSGVGDDGEHLACAGFFHAGVFGVGGAAFPRSARALRAGAAPSRRRSLRAGGRCTRASRGATRRAKGRRGRGVTTDDAAEAQRRRERGGRGARRAVGGEEEGARTRRRRRARGGGGEGREGREDASAEAKDARGREDASAEKGGSAGEGNAGEGGGSDEAV